MTKEQQRACDDIANATSKLKDTELVISYARAWLSKELAMMPADEASSVRNYLDTKLKEAK